MIVALAAGLVLASGLYLALSRDVLRCVLGLALAGSGVNLVLLATGRFSSATPPIVSVGSEVLGPAASSVPQALVLTAIVIGLALACFSLALAVRLVQQSGDDVAAMRGAEPRAEGLKPAILEPEVVDSSTDSAVHAGEGGGAR